MPSIQKRDFGREKCGCFSFSIFYFWLERLENRKEAKNINHLRLSNLSDLSKVGAADRRRGGLMPPLTAFLLALLATPSDRLQRADPEKLARKYGISAQHAAGYLRMIGGVR
jgi:hypothetical protein